jgi:hypothetical protein
MTSICEKSVESVPVVKVINMKKVLIRKPQAPSNEFALRGQAKDAACSFTPF